MGTPDLYYMNTLARYLVSFYEKGCGHHPMNSFNGLGTPSLDPVKE